MRVTIFIVCTNHHTHTQWSTLLYIYDVAILADHLYGHLYLKGLPVTALILFSFCARASCYENMCSKLGPFRELNVVEIFLSAQLR